MDTRQVFLIQERLSIIKNWNVTDPHKVGIDDAIISKAIYFAIPNEFIMDRDLGAA